MTHCNLCKSILKRFPRTISVQSHFFCENCSCLVFEKDFAMHQNTWKFYVVNSEIKFVKYNGNILPEFSFLFSYEAYYDSFNNSLKIANSRLFVSSERVMSHIKFQQKPTFELIKKTIEKYFKLQNII